MLFTFRHRAERTLSDSTEYWKCLRLIDYISNMKLRHLPPAVPPRGSSPPPSPSRFVHLPKALASAVAASLLVVGAVRALPGAIDDTFGFSERRGSTCDVSGAASAHGAFLDDPGPVPDGAAAQVSVRRPPWPSAWAFELDVVSTCLRTSSAAVDDGECPPRGRVAVGGALRGYEMRGDGSEGPAMAPVPDGRPQDIKIWLLADGRIHAPQRPPRPAPGAGPRPWSPGVSRGAGQWRGPAAATRLASASSAAWVWAAAWAAAR